MENKRVEYSATRKTPMDDLQKQTQPFYLYRGTLMETAGFLLMLPINLPRVCVFPRGRFQGSSCLSVKIIKNTKFICEVFSEKLGAIYCRRTKMKMGVKTLKTAVMMQ